VLAWTGPRKQQTDLKRPTKEQTTMNTLTTLYRDLTCAAAAAVISVVASLSFVTSTAVPPAAAHGAVRIAVVQPDQAWFGQPEPAVLVD
jgi:hypothetical protein